MRKYMMEDLWWTKPMQLSASSMIVFNAASKRLTDTLKRFVHSPEDFNLKSVIRTRISTPDIS
jgi:hypothetical protein